jgi:hypothetical protein
MKNAIELMNKANNNKERKLILKNIRNHLNERNKKFSPDRFDCIDIDHLDNRTIEQNKTSLIKAYRSRDFMAMIYDQDGYIRISVCRTAIKDDGNWCDGITFDELLWIKNKIGFLHRDAVEIYPAKDDFVNEANMRHLFILKENLPFIWRRQST